MATSSFALRTFPEFKEAAQAMVRLLGVHHPPHTDEAPPDRYGWISTGSINTVLNSMIAIGLPPMLAIIEGNLRQKQTALATAQTILQFLAQNVAARYAMPSNFEEGSPAQRVISAFDEAERDEDNDSVDPAEKLLPSECDLYELYVRDLRAGDKGLSLPRASKAFAELSDEVNQYTIAKAALQRAIATQPEFGTSGP